MVLDKVEDVVLFCSEQQAQEWGYMSWRHIGAGSKGMRDRVS